MPTLAPLVAALTLVSPAVLPVTSDAALRKVRPVDVLATRLIADGSRRSQTLARLIADLERHDAVIYIQTSPVMHHRGALSFLAHAGRRTYLTIELQACRTPAAMLLALAHELAHALEVATATPAIRTPDDFSRLYMRIGFKSGPREFESRAAQESELAVARELATGATTRRP